MKLTTIYNEIVKKGIDADIRSKSDIDKVLKKAKKAYQDLDKDKKDYFDLDSLTNPFSDTRILNGNPQNDIKSLIVGIDVTGEELLLVDKLKERGEKIDLVVSHHPAGRAYANFYEVMDLQVEAFIKEGVSLAVAQNLLSERKSQVGRRVSAVNHQKTVDIAKLLKLNFLCMHTPCDNLAYQHMRKEIDKKKPTTLVDIIDALYTIPEYQDAAKNNNPPDIVVGNKQSRCKKIHVEFTGGTEGPKEIYEKLASCGIDTIVAMHQSEEHIKQCKKVHINVVIAPHIASDALGINLMLDHLENKDKFKIYEFSGFRRFKRKAKR